VSRIYVASSWRNDRQPGVVDRLRGAGHQVYDFRNPWCGQGGFAWRDVSPDWQNWTPAQYRDVLMTHPTAAQGFLADMRAMQWADTGVLVLPCGRSAHLELGWLAGAGKRTVILLAEMEPELMALIANDICLSIEEVIAVLGRSP
jgi:hypothetical protein